MNVLYVEDYALDAELLQDAMRRRAPDIVLDIVSTVADAIARLSRFEAAYEDQARSRSDEKASVKRIDDAPRYDIVLTDLNLPDGSGLNILSYVRQHHLYLAVVILTGFGEEESVITALHAGANDYVTKRGDYLNSLPRTLQAAIDHFRAEVGRTSRTLHVLYAESSAPDIALTIRELGRRAPHIEIEAVQSSGEVFDRLVGADERHVPDVLLLDYRIRGMAAIELIKELHQGQNIDLPIVLITSDGNEEIGRFAIKLGVADYLVKSPGYLERLPFALESAFYRAASARERTALLKSEREFHSLSDNLPDLVVRFDRQYRYLYANPAIKIATGLPPSVFVGRTSTEVGLPREKVAQLEDAIQRTFDRETNQQMDFSLSGQRGLRFYDARLVPERGTDGKTISVLVIARDLTERKRAEWALQESERFSRSTLDALRENIAVMDEFGTILGVNKAWRALAKGNSGGLEFASEGSNYIDICNRSAAAGNEAAGWIAQSIRALIEGKGMFFSLEYPSHLATEERYFDVQLTRFSGDGPIRIVISHENITVRKQHEKKIERLSRMQAMYSDINSAIVRIHERQALLTEVCRIVVEQSSVGIAWVALVDDEADKIWAAAWWGDIDNGVLADYCASLNTAGLESPGAGVRAIRTQRSVVIENIDKDPHAGALRLEAAKRNYRSVIGLPLLSEKKAIGALVLYASEIDFFTQDEVRLLEELAINISVALEYLAKADRINYLAFYDVLTGLPNRIKFHDRLEQTSRDLGTPPDSSAIVLFDIARFRLINDTFGRLAGDELIRLVAVRLRGAGLPPEDIARIDSNSFAVVLDRVTDALKALQSVESILHIVFELPFRIAGNEYHVKAKCGAVLYRRGAVNIEVLLRHAEVALLNAKRSVESIVFYRSDMDQRSAEALNMENKLRRALEHNQFVLHYQPKFSVVERMITSVEALIRWQDGESLIPPGLFIPILEKTGMILEVGRWVLRQATKDYKDWIDKGLVAPRVACNVSAVQLGHHNFVDDLQHIAYGSTDDGSGLDLEITESVIMESMQDNIPKLRAARELGMSIAIDDFGTGYSSLSYLAKLPVNTLKIDRSFVLEMDMGEQGRVLVASIITLAHSLKLKVVAEGVETDQQRKLLTQLKCDELQGYLISRPVPAGALEKLLSKKVHA